MIAKIIRDRDEDIFGFPPVYTNLMVDFPFSISCPFSIATPLRTHTYLRACTFSSRSCSCCGCFSEARCRGGKAQNYQAASESEGYPEAGEIWLDVAVIWFADPHRCSSARSLFAVRSERYACGVLPWKKSQYFPAKKTQRKHICIKQRSRNPLMSGVLS